MTSGSLQSLQASYGMAPEAFLPELPLSGISLFRWRRLQDAPLHPIEHRLPGYTLSLILQPMRARAWLGSRPVWSGPIEANTIRLTPPDTEPRWQGEGAFDFLLLTIPARTIEAIACDDTPRVHQALKRAHPLYIRDPWVLQTGRRMLDACGGRRYDSQLADGLGMALVAHLLNQYAQDPAPGSRLSLSPSGLRRVTCHVAEHFSEHIRVADLARTAGLSESYFAHAFRAAMGMAPHRFIISMRMDRARQMLHDGGNSIAQIALDCGFKDASHFTRLFRMHFGMTPGKFRRSH